jgi:predicted phosphoribosyltransferase
MLHECDAMVCLNVPADFSAVGQFFNDFDQVSDREVIEALRQGNAKISAAG